MTPMKLKSDPEIYVESVLEAALIQAMQEYGVDTRNLPPARALAKDLTVALKSRLTFVVKDRWLPEMKEVCQSFATKQKPGKAL